MTTRARIIAACIGLIVLVLVSLLGCVPVKTKAPQVVTVTVSHYIAIPAELTKPCVAPELATMTVGGLVVYARELKTALTKCNAQITEIRQLGAQP